MGTGYQGPAALRLRPQGAGNSITASSNNGSSLPSVRSHGAVDTATLSSSGSASTQFTVEKWGQGKNSSLEGILRNQGYSLKEIYTKDSNGQTLIDRVASSNGLKNPNLIQPGQQLSIPSRGGADGSAQMQPGDRQGAAIANGNTGMRTSVQVTPDGSVAGTMGSLNRNRNSRDDIGVIVGPGGRIDSGIGVGANNGAGAMRATSADGSAQVDVRMVSDSDSTVTNVRTTEGRMRTTVNADGTYSTTTRGNDGQSVVTSGGRREQDDEGFFERNVGRALERLFGHREQEGTRGEAIGDNIEHRRGPNGETITVEIHNGQERVIGSSAGNSDDGWGQRAGRAVDGTLDRAGQLWDRVFG